MERTVEYDGLRHWWVRRWAKSTIRDEQFLLHLSHGQTVPVMLMTCCLRAACFRSSSATRDSSYDAVANWHVVRHCARSNGAVLSDWGRRPHLFILVLTVSLYRLTGPHCHICGVCLTTAVRRRPVWSHTHTHILTCPNEASDFFVRRSSKHRQFNSIC